MRVLLATIGSAGDTHPFIAVGKRLRARGHEVFMAANPHFHPRIRDAGLEPIALGEEAELLRVLMDPRLANQRQSPYLVLEELFNNSIEPSFEALRRAVREIRPDAIVRHHILPAARWVGELEGVPVATVALTPSMWFAKGEPMILRSHIPDWLQQALSPVIRQAGRLALRWLVDRPVNRARLRLGLPPMRDVLATEARSGARVLGLWSSHFRPPRSGDPANSHVCGYTFFDRATPADRTLDPALERFLDRHEQTGRGVIAFTLGTAIVHHAPQFFEHAARVARRLERAVVLLTGSLGEGHTPVGQSLARRTQDDPLVFVHPYAPHSLLMPRAAASVHHAGAGSSGQALRSGRPSLSVPFVNDEFDIAWRLQRLGVAQTLPAERVDEQRLADALSTLLRSTECAERARRIGQLVQAEDGADRAAAEIEAMVSARSA